MKNKKEIPCVTDDDREITAGYAKIFEETIGRMYESGLIINHGKIEHESRDGFLPFTEGGYQYNCFIPVSYIVGTGYPLPTIKGKDTGIVFQWQTRAHEYAEKELNVKYEDIESDELLNDFQGYEDAYFDDATIMLSFRIQIYDADNRRAAIEGKKSVLIMAYINDESPYHRDSYNQYTHEVANAYKTTDELKKIIDRAIKKIAQDWAGK